MKCELLKQRFLELIQDAFCVGKDSENEIAGPGDHLKHPFLDLTQFEFCAGQHAESMFREPCGP